MCECRKTHKFCRLGRLMDLTGTSRTGVYEKLDKNSPRYDATFPKPIKIGACAVAFLESDIYRWMQERIDESIKGD
ncbi:AlpA family transcriptional regulator [Pseudomonas sp. MPR-ANC1]|uniref:helix-turn-helix transcriptional regulator n=1 Tax=Pseudomonas sp. MPR-ANC1 TaxID=2075548 RepID=UPI000CD2BBD3|nr:AlpA family phage regulatory protein [Pseudomonas sp. MPR-ANC1]POA48328.1 AlpA family transcriptional regulator [Pseudomonas sp. MPR-ANC1]